MKSNIAELLDRAEGILGAEFVHRAPAHERWSAATFAPTASVLGVVRPRTTAEVQAVVRLCARHRVPTYASSRGRNWGYGSATPVRDGLVMDLSRLDRILGYNDRLGYVRVEPGVTFGQLYDFLQANGRRHWIDAPGCGRGGSVAGNALERGFGHTAYADHAAQVCSLQVVLADGQLLETGLGAFQGAVGQHVYASGLGPNIGGLFFQGNLGIVTEMTVWLMPAPERFVGFFFSVDGNARYAEVIDALSALRLAGILNSAVHVGNSYRVLASLAQYPWDLTRDTTPLRGEALDQLKARYGTLDWHGSGALYGPPSYVAEGRRALRRALRGIASQLVFLDDRRLRALERLAPALRVLGARRVVRQLDVLRPAFELLKGVPTDYFLRSAYWRKRTPIPEVCDPDRDRCGLIWCAVISEAEGRQAGEVEAIASRELLGSGFEPGVTCTLLSGRCLDHVISIAYDRDVPGEDGRAMQAFERLLQSLTRAGYFPYRIPTFAQDFLDRAMPAYRSFLTAVKSAVDPLGILAPGRYVPTPRPETG